MIVNTIMGPLNTYIGRCCREWVMLPLFKGRCGLCGEMPRYERPDDL
jgi:hypothetical protein